MPWSVDRTILHCLSSAACPWRAPWAGGPPPASLHACRIRSRGGAAAGLSLHEDVVACAETPARSERYRSSCRNSESGAKALACWKPLPSRSPRTNHSLVRVEEATWTGRQGDECSTSVCCGVLAPGESEHPRWALLPSCHMRNQRDDERRPAVVIAWPKKLLCLRRDRSADILTSGMRQPSMKLSGRVARSHEATARG